MSKKPTIGVIGSLNTDFVCLTSRVPGPGETLTAKALHVNAGGKGANQAVACGKASFQSKDNQDVRVEMIGSVGKNDPYYTSLLKPTLANGGVGTSGISEIDGSQTGTATILVEDNGENRILFVPGANYDGMKDCRALVEAAGKPEVLVLQGEIPRDTTFDLLEHFGKTDTSIVMNPAPVFPGGIPPNILANVDFLIVNETECFLLASHNDKISISVQDEENVSLAELQHIAASFHTAANVRNILITLGAKGIFYSAQDGREDLVPGVKVSNVVDTTAAGDTFVGYFSAALARHIAGGGLQSDFDLSTACQKANAASAITVQRSGAMQSIPFGYEVN
jgi:ribokinase